MGIVIELENVTKVYNNGKVRVEALRGVPRMDARSRRPENQNVPVYTSVRLFVHEVSAQFVCTKNGRKLLPMVLIAS